jgi:hypothetical protein
MLSVKSLVKTEKRRNSYLCYDGWKVVMYLKYPNPPILGNSPLGSPTPPLRVFILKHGAQKE